MMILGSGTWIRKIYLQGSEDYYSSPHVDLISNYGHESDNTHFWIIYLFVIALAFIFALSEKRAKEPSSQSLLKNTLFGILFFASAIIGYVVSIVLVLVALVLVLGSLFWLYDQNVNFFSVLVAVLDLVIVVVFVKILRSKSLRNSIIRIWREIMGNI